MKPILLPLLALVATAAITSCGGKKPSDDCAAQKPAVMWIDAEGNFERLNNADSIDKYVNLLADLGFNHLVVDARPLTGELMYETEIGPRYRGIHERKTIEPDSTLDYLGRFIEKAHARDMKVLFSMNVFCAGHNFFHQGQIYDGHPEWASMVQDPERGIVPITEMGHKPDKYGAMVNPANAEYQDYIIDVMKDMIAHYPEVDGLVLDRGRYDGITADFSDMSRTEFEKYLGKELTAWPDDALKIVRTESGRDSVATGEHFKDWIYWRSKVITDFMARARNEIKAADPDMIFSVYSGAWYPSYYEVGVNFASKDYDTAKDFAWAREDYGNTGYAELIDLYMTGNYYTDITIADYENDPSPISNETDFGTHAGDWYCVEGSCHHLREILGPNKFVGGLLIDQLYPQIDRLPEAMAMNVKESDGLMMFDLCHITNANIWDKVREGMILSGFLTENKE